MSNEIISIEKMLSLFLEEQAKGNMAHFGFLLIPSDGQLNDEALRNIKTEWHDFCDKNGHKP